MKKKLPGEIDPPPDFFHQIRILVNEENDRIVIMVPQEKGEPASLGMTPRQAKKLIGKLSTCIRFLERNP